MDQYERGETATLSGKAQELAMLARATLQAHHRLLEEHGMTPNACLAELRRVGGEAAVEKVRRQAEETLRTMDERIEREVMHAPASSRPLSRRLAQHGRRL
ncbi:hypothetical protein [Variovorax soli]|uniref:Uncharacterized protein n=1 Tax=Variovorax soli TaxID=376815 RepID=A0ABU1NEU1_9BURK|nr:hypothetical protein [Variovorax soli]MDR6536957.1 hypothetical protein [Variovorax soli]